MFPSTFGLPKKMEDDTTQPCARSLKSKASHTQDIMALGLKNKSETLGISLLMNYLRFIDEVKA
jgi:hypothetical protein